MATSWGAQVSPGSLPPGYRYSKVGSTSGAACPLVASSGTSAALRTEGKPPLFGGQGSSSPKIPECKGQSLSRGTVSSCHCQSGPCSVLTAQPLSNNTQCLKGEETDTPSQQFVSM